MEKIEYEQFYGQISSLVGAEKIFNEMPNFRFKYLILQYYGQGGAILTENGLNHWKSFVANMISQQGYKRNIRRYAVPSLRLFASQAGKKEVMLIKEINRKCYVLEDEKQPEMSDRSVDNRLFSDWMRNGAIAFWVINELGDSIFGNTTPDFLISQLQYNCQARVSNKVAAAWKSHVRKWHEDSLGKVVEYPLLKEFLDNVPEPFNKEIKYLVQPSEPVKKKRGALFQL